MRMPNLRIGKRVLLIVIAAVIGMAAVGTIGTLALRDNLLHDRQEKARDTVLLAHQIVAYFHELSTSGRLSRSDAEGMAATLIARLRYGDGDYFWINDTQPRMITHPNAALVGKDMSDFQEKGGKFLFQEFARLAVSKGEGYVPYLWPKVTGGPPVEKTSFIKLYEPWGWVVGSGVYLDDVDHIFTEQATMLALVILGVVAVVAALSGLISRTITVPVRAMTEAMQRLAKGDLAVAIPVPWFRDEVAEMAGALGVFRTNAIESRRLLQAREQERIDHERQMQDAVRTAERQVGQEISALAEAFAAGDLSHRMATDGRDGILLSLCGNVNHLAQTLEAAIADVCRTATALAEGDLETRITNDYKGAFLALTESLNTTSVRLVEIVLNIRAAGDAIATAAHDMSTGSSDLSERIEQQAAGLEQTAASMEELSASVRHVADNTQRANRMVASACTAAEEGGTISASAIKAMGEIADSSHKITDIIAVIEEMAFQTNLLALNAAVEAARAGDAGRGFAVVAQEVRVLAQRSAQASREIKALILSSDSQVRTGVDLVGRAGRALEGIRDGVRQVAELIEDIAAGSSEQAHALDEINAALAAMDETNQKNTAMVEQTAVAARAMDEQAGALRQQMAIFRIAGDQGDERAATQERGGAAGSGAAHMTSLPARPASHRHAALALTDGRRLKGGHPPAQEAISRAGQATSSRRAAARPS